MDEAFAGDIVGLPDSSSFKIGDTLTAGESFIQGITFSLRCSGNYIENADPMKSKQLKESSS